MKVKVYSTEVCPKCNRLKIYLQDKLIPFEVVDMSTPESMTELNFNGVFTVTAPVLQVRNEFFTSGELFKNGAIDENKINQILEDKRYCIFCGKKLSENEIEYCEEHNGAEL